MCCRERLDAVALSIVSVFLFFGCCNDDNIVQSNKDTLPPRFSVDGKIVVSGLWEYCWDRGDKVALFYNDTLHCYSYDGVTQQDKVLLKKENSLFFEGAHFTPFLFAPYNAITPVDNGFKVSFKDKQYFNNKLDKDALFLFSGLREQNKNAITFQAFQGIIKVLFFVPNEVVTRAVFRGNNDEVLSGNSTLHFNGDSIDNFTIEEGSRSIEVICDGLNDIGEIAFIVPPIDFGKGFTISIFTKSGKEISKCYHDSYFCEPNSYKELSFRTDDVDFNFFELSDGTNSFTPFLIKDSTIHVVIPNNYDSSLLIAHLEHNGIEVFQDSDNGSFSDFTKPMRFVIRSVNGKEKTWILNLYNLPVIVINTPNSVPIESRDIRVEGCQIFQINEDGTIDSLGTAGIKGRGNATWTKSSKKPYNVKLDKKRSVLGMNKSKHWILLANAHYDLTSLHNAVALKFSNQTDYKWTPHGEFCELILNGEHRGLYFLCEKIRVEKGKIDITEIGPNDLSGEALTGGYMIESTIYPEQAEGIFFSTNIFNKSGGWPLYWFYDLPEGDEVDIPQVQQDYLTERLNHLESLLYDADSLLSHKYLDYLNVESLINWFLIEEVTQNEEASRTKNVRIYKDRGDEHFYIGPPWDFDAWSFGCVKYEYWLTKESSLWLEQLFKDPLFVTRVKEKWDVYKKIWRTEGIDYMNNQYDRIFKAAKRNNTMWTEWCWAYQDMSFEESVEKMRQSIIHRIEWMDERIGAW